MPAYVYICIYLLLFQRKTCPSMLFTHTMFTTMSIIYIYLGRLYYKEGGISGDNLEKKYKKGTEKEN